MPLGGPSWRKLLIGVCHGDLKKSIIDGRREERGFDGDPTRRVLTI
jgi:hypothetical protein